MLASLGVIGIGLILGGFYLALTVDLPAVDLNGGLRNLNEE